MSKKLFKKSGEYKIEKGFDEHEFLFGNKRILLIEQYKNVKIQAIKDELSSLRMKNVLEKVFNKGYLSGFEGKNFSENFNVQRLWEENIARLRENNEDNEF